MNGKLYFRNLLVFGGILALAACTDDASRAGRPTIYDISTQDDTELCTNYYSFTDEICYETCPEKTHVGTDTEVKDLITEISAETDDPDAAKILLQEIVDAAAGI